MLKTAYAYDTLGSLVRVTDTLTNTTVITYNALGQKTGMLDPDMGRWSYQYDAAGNLTRQTDARNQRICFYYDPLNRVTGKHFRADDNCPTSSPALTVTYTYDAGTNGKGRRTSMSDPSGSTTWTYDVRGRVTSEAKTINSVSTFATAFGYDAMDRVITTTYPTGEVVTQTYNTQALLENLRSINQAGSYNQWYAPNLDYNAAGQVTLMRLGNPLTTTYTYDALSLRLKRIQTGGLLDLNTAYDLVGNITRITDTVNSGQVITFTYDALDRLIGAKTTLAGTGQYTHAYAYNPIGNLTNMAGVTQWYSDTAHVHTVTHLTGTQKFWYDANGNMTRRVEGGATYSQTWDAENRLTVVTNTVSGAVTRFYYDGDGARVKKVDSTGTTAYAGAVEVAITGTLRITRTYYSANSLVAMRVVTSTGGNTLYYLHADHLGSTSLTTNVSGTVVARQSYYPYGAVRSGGGMPTDIGFTGQRAENASLGSLMFYQARFYSPAVGRFLSADTLVPEAGNPQAFNRYAYTLNNPVRHIDPDGHTIRCPLFQRCSGTPIAKTSDWTDIGKHIAGALCLLLGCEMDWENNALWMASPNAVAAGALNPIGMVTVPGTSPSSPVVSKFTSKLREVLSKFGKAAEEVNRARGMVSFSAEYWDIVGDAAMSNPNDLFLAQAGDEVVGAMKLRSAPTLLPDGAKALHIQTLEGTGGGAGTALLREAYQESIRRGYRGSISLFAAGQAVEFYKRFPGYVFDELNGFIYWSAEAASKAFGSLGSVP